MITLSRVRSAEVVEAVEVATEGSAAGSGLAPQPPFLSVLIVLLLAAGTAGLALPASANNAPVGPMSIGGGPMLSGTAGVGPQWTAPRHARSVRFDAQHKRLEARAIFERRFHRHGDRLFGRGFLPFGFYGGFGWPDFEPALAATSPDPDANDDTRWRGLSFSGRPDRYEPPTVEQSPSGVTIIRGPGSHHGTSPP